jgi:hypothetical protein
MARQQDSGWRCGTQPVAEAQPALSVIPADADADRSTNESSFAAGVTLALPATAT